MGNELRDKLLAAALPHVAFDGWGEVVLMAAAKKCDVTAEAARAEFPRGALDMAVAFHQSGDGVMVARMQSEDMASMRYSEKVAAAVRYRLEAVDDKDLVRRGMTLFSLPQNAADGAKLVWGTADRIWDELGDTSDDINWYSKRAILSGVYGSCVLFWLGDTSDGHGATWEFVDRRIEDVMRFEKFKGQVRESKVLSPLLSIPEALFSRVRAPSKDRRTDMPGHWKGT
jgi:ubiquinone biosynthesis protein COQ9